MRLPAKASELSAKRSARQALLDLEELMLQQPEGTTGEELEVKHRFAPGVYARELFIPAGLLLTGKIHKTEHVSIMLSGRMLVPDGNGGNKEINGPMVEIAKPGTKRVGICLEDTRWVTVHPTDETDLDVIENMLIAKDFSEVQHILDQQDYDDFVIEYDITESDIEALRALPHTEAAADNVILGPSKRHGYGVFVLGVVEAGEIVAPATVDGEDTQYGRYMNHSCNPNVRFDGYNFIALRRIQSEEAVVDYRFIIERLRI